MLIGEGGLIGMRALNYYTRASFSCSLWDTYFRYRIIIFFVFKIYSQLLHLYPLLNLPTPPISKAWKFERLGHTYWKVTTVSLRDKVLLFLQKPVSINYLHIMSTSLVAYYVQTAKFLKSLTPSHSQLCLKFSYNQIQKRPLGLLESITTHLLFYLGWNLLLDVLSSLNRLEHTF